MEDEVEICLISIFSLPGSEELYQVAVYDEDDKEVASIKNLSRSHELIRSGVIETKSQNFNFNVDMTEFNESMKEVKKSLESIDVTTLTKQMEAIQKTLYSQTIYSKFIRRSFTI